MTETTPDDDQPIEKLRNLGPKSAGWLEEVGIETIADLKRSGSVLAYQLVRQRRPDVSVNLLWAMEAGLDNRDWRELTGEEKQRLRQQLDDAPS